MAKHDIVVLNSTSSGFETDLGNNTARIKGDANEVFSVRNASEVSKFSVDTTNASVTFTTNITSSGHVTSSVGSTGSFGRVDVTKISGDASLMTNVNEIGHISTSAQLATAISGAFNAGFTTTGDISGSSTSTGSFGYIYSPTYSGDASLMTNVNEDGHFSGSAQMASNISGSHTSGFELEGTISGSATSTGSFGRVVWGGNIGVTDASAVTGITSLYPTGTVSGSAQLATAISGSHTSGFEFASGNISGSATSTGSFGRIDFIGTGLSGNASQMTNVPVDTGTLSGSGQIATQISGSFNKGFSYGGEISGSVTSTGSFGQFYSDKYVGDATAVAGMTGLTEPEGALSSSVQIADQVSGSFRQGFTFSGLISGSLTSTGSLGRVNVDTIYANSFKDVIISTGVNSGSNALKYNAKDLATEISGAFESGFNLKSGKMISGSVTSTGSFGEIRASVVSTVNMTTGLRKPVSGSMDHVSYTSGSFNTRRSNKPFRIPIFGRGHDISTQQFTATGSMQSQKYRSQAGQLFINNFGQLGITIQTGSLGPVAGTWTEGPDYPGNARGPGAVGTPNAAMMVGGQSLTSSAQYDGISWSGTADSTHKRDAGANNKSVGSVDAAGFIGHTGGLGGFSAPGFPAVPNFNDFFETWDGVSFSRCGAAAGRISGHSFRFGAAAKGGSANSHIVFGGDYGEYGYSRTSCWNGVTWQAASYAINNDREYGAGFGGVHDAVYAGGAAPLNDCTEEWNGATWATATALPTVQQAGGGMGATQNAGLIAGGSTTTLVQEYNGTTWSEQSALPTGTNEHGTAGSAAAGFVLAGLSGADAFQQWTGGFVSGSVESTTVQACGYNNFSQNPTGRYLLTKRIEGSLSPSHVQTSGITSGSNTLSDGLTQGKGFGGGY